jgi:hypothetical protein
MDIDEKFAVAMKIVCATAIGIACSLISCSDEVNAAIEASKEATQDAPVQVEHANGCPLDAVAYDAPAFENRGSKALKVTDRFSGASWWLVKMGRSWVALPIESEEAGK